MQNQNSDKQQTISNAAFDFAFDMALRDATLRTASPGVPLNELRETPEIRNIVRRHIEWLLREVRTNYSDTFYATAGKLEQAFRNKFPSGSRFTFGNAQKVINMTVKYLYVGAQYNPDLRARFSVCHCPMDNVMINFVTDFLNNNQNRALGPSEQEALAEFKGTCLRPICRSANKGKLIWNGPSWSSMGSKEIEKYKLFQGAIEIIGRHHIPQLSPLEVDLVNWKPAS